MRRRHAGKVLPDEQCREQRSKDETSGIDDERLPTQKRLFGRIVDGEESLRYAFVEFGQEGRFQVILKLLNDESQNRKGNII